MYFIDHINVQNCTVKSLEKISTNNLEKKSYIKNFYFQNELCNKINIVPVHINKNSI